jgi:hypothetical protein
MEHKRGDTFDYVATIPDTFADGYFVGWDVTAQIRKAASGPLAQLSAPVDGELVAQLDVTWTDAATTRQLRLLKVDTKAWPVGPLEFDVQFRRADDGYTLSTATEKLVVIKDVTQ